MTSSYTKRKRGFLIRRSWHNRNMEEYNLFRYVLLRRTSVTLKEFKKLRNKDIAQRLRLVKRVKHQEKLSIYDTVCAINCPPAVWYTLPNTNRCSRPMICPWCFIRNYLMPIRKALMSEVVQEIEDPQIVCWMNVSNDTPNDSLFYPKTCRLFYQLKPRFYVQLRFPVVSYATIPNDIQLQQQICYRYLTIAVASSTANILEKIKRFSDKTGNDIKPSRVLPHSSLNVYRVMANFVPNPFTTLLTEEFSESYSDLFFNPPSVLKNSRALRIVKPKLKGK